MNLQHLRRFAKPEFLPDRVRNSITPTPRYRPDPSLRTLVTSTDNGAGLGDGTTDVEMNEVDGVQPSLYLLICATSTLPTERLSKVLSALTPFADGALEPAVQTIQVPLLPPTSEEQSQQWSEQYWPTVYKRNNPFGPHPSIVSRAEDEICSSAGQWISLATQAGLEASAALIGEAIGAVIIDRNVPGGCSVVAVAGDARLKDENILDEGLTRAGGNVMAHAVMRAIGMVARKRLALSSDRAQTASDPGEAKVFADEPLTPVELTVHSKNTLAAGGYLCLDLDIYVTHEPCIMCSMAILHSRFGRVVFGTRMPNTGGLTAEVERSTSIPGLPDVHMGCDSKTPDGTNPAEKRPPGGLGYGLFWRPELNWKLLAWQWIDQDSLQVALDENVHV